MRKWRFIDFLFVLTGILGLFMMPIMTNGANPFVKGVCLMDIIGCNMDNFACFVIEAVRMWRSFKQLFPLHLGFLILLSNPTSCLLPRLDTGIKKRAAQG